MNRRITMNNYSTDFKDFNAEELVGKYVLYESGMTYSTNLYRAIRVITKVTKTGFRISKLDDVLFSLTNGEQKGLTGKFNMGKISHCILLTDAERDAISREWVYNSSMKKAKEEIQLILKEGKQSLEQLNQILEILNKENKNELS